MTTNDSLLLSRSKLATFLACRRRFQLRYLEQRPWPEAPLSAADEQRLQRGQQFHQLVQRQFLGLNIEPVWPKPPLSTAAEEQQFLGMNMVPATIEDRTVRDWWLTFVRSSPQLPHGRLLPELTLTTPVGGHLLHGRFDLLVIGEEEGALFAHIFDWKTGRPQEESTLRHDWQTRLYLALLAEGGQALRDEGESRSLSADHIAITYWYTTAADAPHVIRYNQAWHRQNWAELTAIVAEIEAQRAAGGVWPLTEDWTLCRTCAYQALCGRQAAGTAVPIADDEESTAVAGQQLEPHFP